MNAVLQAELSLRPMVVSDLDAVLAVEVTAYSVPWTRGNFIDSLAAGHWAELLVDAQSRPRAYFVAMPAIDELHLLNLTVAPEHQGRGLARSMLDHLDRRCRAAALHSLWLEVRSSNQRAQHVYRQRGFCEVGRRRSYYPAPPGREDAIVMQLTFDREAPRELD